MTRIKLHRIVIGLILAIFITGTARSQMDHTATKGAAPTRAIAVLHPTKGNSVSGVVRFEAVEGGMHVVADIWGLAPGKHGFHIHEYGDCSSEDGTSAGGHFNPAGMPHSMPASEQRHVGDLGNVEADKDGKAHLDYVDAMISLTGTNSIIGRSVIVHEKEDDLKTQPTGAAGARVANGVVGIAK